MTLEDPPRNQDDAADEAEGISGVPEQPSTDAVPEEPSGSASSTTEVSSAEPSSSPGEAAQDEIPY